MLIHRLHLDIIYSVRVGCNPWFSRSCFTGAAVFLTITIYATTGIVTLLTRNASPRRYSSKAGIEAWLGATFYCSGATCMASVGMHFIASNSVKGFVLQSFLPQCIECRCR